MMEQHPIPQDITGFKFKLVGDMTLKQFGFLAAGATTAWLIYSTPWYPLVRYPLAIIFGLSGAAFAFLPIEDRPLEIWVVNFIKSIYKPTYLVWQKGNSSDMTMPSAVINQSALPKIDLPTPQLWPFPKNQPLAGSQGPVEGKSQATETLTQGVPPSPPPGPSLEILASEHTQSPVPTPPAAAANPTLGPSIAELEKIRQEKLELLAKEKELLAQKEKQVESEKNPMDYLAITDVSALEKLRLEAKAPKAGEQQAALEASQNQLNDLLKQNQELSNQIEVIEKRLAELSGQEKAGLESSLQQLTSSKSQLSSQISELQKSLSDLRVMTANQPSPNISKPIVHPVMRNTQTLSLSDIPNVISGLVKTAKGEPLGGVIVLIKDKTGNPIRALKTNKIGQFITNTPLENGPYLLELEKEGTNFDQYQIKLEGKVMPLLELTSE